MTSGVSPGTGTGRSSTGLTPLVKKSCRTAEESPSVLQDSVGLYRDTCDGLRRFCGIPAGLFVGLTCPVGFLWDYLCRISCPVGFLQEYLCRTSVHAGFL